MAGVVLDGRRLAAAVVEEVAARVRALAARAGDGRPALAVLLVGADAAARRHARLKSEACRRAGMRALEIDLPAGATPAETLAEIDRLNDDPAVHGIFLQHPVPRHLDERLCFDRIALAKDVGGDSSASLGRLARGESGFGGATPAAVMRLLGGYGVPVAGRRAVVVGRSPMVGKPMALMLLGADATVTLCHSRTLGLPEIVERGEIVVGAVGQPEFIKGRWIRDGAVVIDAGLHLGGGGGDTTEDGGGVGAQRGAVVGDVELAAVVERCSAYTPVPGGVGPMTVALLLERTVAAAERAAGAGSMAPPR